MAMDKPNLLCVPKPKDFDMLRIEGDQDDNVSEDDISREGSDGEEEEGAGRHVGFTCNVRGAFVAPEGYVLVGVDYR